MPFQKGNKLSRGRPKAGHTISAEKAREVLVREVTNRMEDLLKAKFALALGHKRVKTTPTGKEIIYSISPDGSSIEYLFNQAIGRPKETTELVSSPNKPLQILFIVKESMERIYGQDNKRNN